MREKKTKPHSVIFSSILLFVAISPLFIHAINTNYTIESNATPVSVEKPKISDYWNLEYIRIDNNWSHTAGNYTWCFKENGFYVIENVTIDATGAPNNIGLEIRNSNEYFIIRNCTILNSGNIGISLDDVNNGTLNNNTFESNYRGIWINNGSNNTITDCKIIGSGGTGIALSLSTNNTIESNTINCVGSYQGIYLQSSSHNNTISKNTVTGATQADPDWGVGIAIQSSDICIISHNSIKNNKFGIKLRNGADNNSVKSNSIENNSQYGLQIENSTSQCHYNTIYNNTFKNPSGTNAYDNSSTTRWSLGTLGNYWDDYSGVDADDNEIGDTPYLIGGYANSQDNYPIWDDGPEGSQANLPLGHYYLLILGIGIVSLILFENRKKRMIKQY